MSKNKGITLIALIITIIVMLILVAVTITMAVNGGLFGYAGNATKETKAEKDKETEWTNPGDNLSSDELIEFYTSGPKDWTIAWVYKNGAWSNPYFKDKELENEFTFNYLDTNYSINSENELTGQFVAKLYTDGELVISGTGALPDLVETEGMGGIEPWMGSVHHSGEFSGYYLDGGLPEYLEDNISSVTLAEGITEIPTGCFEEMPIENVRFSETITKIGMEAFKYTDWIVNLSDTHEYEEDYYQNELFCIYVPINGITFILAVRNLGD